MAYDQKLASRIHDMLSVRSGFVEKKMFGGVGYLFRGNMACGVNGENLIVRVGPDDYQDVLNDPNAGVFDITGRPMRGWVSIGSGGTRDDEMLQAWVERGVAFALSLPAK